ncbi:unnamed protein product [marine sediment metagenome]|uniref:Uncharacterized protein n=1 Tax=marine sediment metagenome TaxID=412755 RepID=X0U557_9ZZZZ
MSNAIRWLAEAGGGAKLMTVRPGTMLRFAAPPEAQTAQVVLPDGRRQSLAAADGEVAFTEADRVGVYSLSAGERQWRFAVDLRSAEESDLTPRDELQLGERKVVAEAGAPKVRQHLWPYLALLALAVLMAEWHLYHRRY